MRREGTRCIDEPFDRLTALSNIEGLHRIAVNLDPEDTRGAGGGY
jgi:hypothetical protein